MVVGEVRFTGGFNRPAHVEVGERASKTIFTENIVRGVLNVVKTGGKGKVIVSNNADDSADDSIDEAVV